MQRSKQKVRAAALTGFSSLCLPFQDDYFYVMKLLRSTSGCKDKCSKDVPWALLHDLLHANGHV